MLEDNKLLDRNEEFLNTRFSDDISSIVDYVKDSLNEMYKLEDVRVEAKSHYRNQTPTHIVVKILGVGHGTIEVLTLTRKNIDQRIESIAVLLLDGIRNNNKKKQVEYTARTNLLKFEY